MYYRKCKIIVKLSWFYRRRLKFFFVFCFSCVSSSKGLVNSWDLEKKSSTYRVVRVFECSSYRESTVIGNHFKVFFLRDRRDRKAKPIRMQKKIKTAEDEKKNCMADYNNAFIRVLRVYCRYLIFVKFLTYLVML